MAHLLTLMPHAYTTPQRLPMVAVEDLAYAAWPISHPPTATVKSIELAAFMDQAGSDHVLAVRVSHAGSIIMTLAVAAIFAG